MGFYTAAYERGVLVGLNTDVLLSPSPSTSYNLIPADPNQINVWNRSRPVEGVSV